MVVLIDKAKKRKSLNVSVSLPQESLFEEVTDKFREKAPRSDIEPLAERQDVGSAPPYKLSDHELSDHYATCIKLCAENKITIKNAFSLHLIDHMSQYVHSQSQNDDTNFQVASNTIDASSKIYSYRVDGYYSEAFRLLSLLSHKSEDVHEGGNEETDEVENQPGKEKNKAKKRVKPSGSNIEKNLKNINRPRTENLRNCDPLFQKMSAGFDCGSPSGLFLYNTAVKSDDTFGLMVDHKYCTEMTRKYEALMRERPVIKHTLPQDLDFLMAELQKIDHKVLRLCPLTEEVGFAKDREMDISRMLNKMRISEYNGGDRAEHRGDADDDFNAYNPSEDGGGSSFLIEKEVQDATTVGADGRSRISSLFNPPLQSVNELANGLFVDPLKISPLPALSEEEEDAGLNDMGAEFDDIGARADLWGNTRDPNDELALGNFPEMGSDQAKILLLQNDPNDPSRIFKPAGPNLPERIEWNTTSMGHLLLADSNNYPIDSSNYNRTIMLDTKSLRPRVPAFSSQISELTSSQRTATTKSLQKRIRRPPFRIDFMAQFYQKKLDVSHQSNDNNLSSNDKTLTAEDSNRLEDQTLPENAIPIIKITPPTSTDIDPQISGPAKAAEPPANSITLAQALELFERLYKPISRKNDNQLTKVTLAKMRAKSAKLSVYRSATTINAGDINSECEKYGGDSATFDPEIEFFCLSTLPNYKLFMRNNIVSLIRRPPPSFSRIFNSTLLQKSHSDSVSGRDTTRNLMESHPGMLTLNVETLSYMSLLGRENIPPEDCPNGNKQVVHNLSTDSGFLPMDEEPCDHDNNDIRNHTVLHMAYPQTSQNASRAGQLNQQDPLNETYMGQELLQPIRKIENLKIAYDKRTQVTDIRKLKRKAWEFLSQTLERPINQDHDLNNNNNCPPSPILFSNIDEQFDPNHPLALDKTFEGPPKTTFGALRKHLKTPSNQGDRPNPFVHVTDQILLLTLLFLANEKNLHLVNNNNDFSDISIYMENNDGENNVHE